MGRYSTYPPQTMGEWMVGLSLKDKKLRNTVRPIVKVEMSEDELSGDETIAITVPGRRRGKLATKPSLKSQSSRQVRFDRKLTPSKSSLKAGSISSSETLVESETSDSSPEESDTSESETTLRQRLRRERKVTAAKAAAVCQKDADSEDTSATEDSLPHPTCDCKDCVKGRKILKAIKDVRDAQKAKQKSKDKANKKDDPSSTDITDTEGESDASEEPKQQKGKKNKSKGKANKKDDPSSTDVTNADGESDASDEPKQQKGKKNKSNPKENAKKSPNDGKDKSGGKGKGGKQDTKEKSPEPPYNTAFAVPKYMKPEFIMPPKAKVMQVEHTLGTPFDPQPNAFIDQGKGILRVYHNSIYGNPTGELYGAPAPPRGQRPPPGHFPPPPMEYWPYDFPPGLGGPAPPPGQYPPPPPWAIPPGAFVGDHNSKHAQKTSRMSPTNVHHTAMPPIDTGAKNVASQGFGLSGNACPPTPQYLRDERARMAQDATNNVGPSFNGDGKPPHAGSDKASRKSGKSKKSDNIWGGNGAGDWGKSASFAVPAVSVAPSKAPSPFKPASTKSFRADDAQGGAGGNTWNNNNAAGGDPRDNSAAKHDFSEWPRSKKSFNKNGSQRNSPQNGGATWGGGGNGDENGWNGNATGGVGKYPWNNNANKPASNNGANDWNNNKPASNNGGTNDWNNNKPASNNGGTNDWNHNKPASNNGANDWNNNKPASNNGGTNDWNHNKPASNNGGTNDWNHNKPASNNGGTNDWNHNKPASNSGGANDWNAGSGSNNQNANGGGAAEWDNNQSNGPIMPGSWVDGNGRSERPSSRRASHKGSPPPSWNNVGGQGPTPSNAGSQSGGWNQNHRGNGGNGNGQSQHGGSPNNNNNVGWNEAPANNAGPEPPAWADTSFAQDTNGKADNW